MRKLLTLLLLCSAVSVAARHSERLYLSGTGLGDTRTWQFFCTEGMRSGSWSTIEVPSQWELQGFGAYSYGRWYMDKSIAHPPREQGIYRYGFDVPASWRGRAVRIVFEGVMTDTELKVNGRSAGDIHRGGFNEFSYDISRLLRYGARNEIEVTVSKESSDKTVNGAERKADWWIFGGIYRPVYLEAKPAAHIVRLALDPKADGSLSARVFTSPLKKGYSIAFDIDGEHAVTSPIEAGTEHLLHASWPDIRPWDAEHPNLYTLGVVLLDPQGRVVHRCEERIGFRTVEFRPRDGLYVNGTRVVLKGINRHSFHPDGGRTTNREVSLQDGLLIKQMNMNAVRMHYAPDRHFLDICDSLGLYVIDELAGWHGAYGTEVGMKLQEEFVARDLNHPAIILWSNGNEGGWNTRLDARFAELDPQQRHVIHPWADFDELDTHHYPAYQTGVARFTNGHKLFMPTEFMHGTYDQGHGAGLEDFWEKYTASPLFVGGFMWDFSDNAVRRTDRGGILDSDGSNGSDGILGPYREKEGSFYAVREIWSPVHFRPLRITPSFDGRMAVENRWLTTPLGECTARYRVLKVTSPLNGARQESIAEGDVALPDIEPGCTAYARMTLPNNFTEGDVLEVTAFDPAGRPLCTRTWPIRYTADYAARERAGIVAAAPASAAGNDGCITLAGGDVRIDFDAATGRIVGVRNGGGALSFGGGPLPEGMNARFDRALFRTEGDRAVATFHYLGAIDSIRWELDGAGLLSMHAVTLDRASGGKGFDDAVTAGGILNFGFSFTYPESKVEGVEWFGRGPYRVWKNRLPGANLGLWSKEYNDTLTGAAFERLVYPEFKGYHADLYWATLRTSEGGFSVYSLSDGLYLRLYTPAEPDDNKAHAAYPVFPSGDLSFLYEIPAIRDFKPLEQHGPKSQPGDIRIKKGDEGVHMHLMFDFRQRH